jgi:hypothetical protein
VAIVAQGAMQDSPLPFAVCWVFVGHWITVWWRTPATVVPAPSAVHHVLHEGSSELERVLALQHELLQLCQRQAVDAPAGYSWPVLAAALLSGFVLGAAAVAHLACRLRGSAVAVATVNASHDSRTVRFTPGEYEPRALTNSAGSSPGSSEVSEGSLRVRRGRILQ